MMKKIIAWGFAVCLLGSLMACSSSRKKFDQELAGESCDQALKDLPHEQTGAKVTTQVQQLANNIAAYTYITAAYTTQILWNGTTGTVVLVGFCGPYVIGLVAAASTSHYWPSGPYRSKEDAYSPGPSLKGDLPLCNKDTVQAVYGAVKLPKIGKAAQKQGQEWMCPDLKTPNEAIRQVASCYEKRGDKESLEKAITTMKSVEFSPQFFGCLKPEDQKAHMDYLEKLETLLKESS